ncbi:Tagatose/fructose phosphokinase [Moorella glycerini]|uniref:Tagatose-6-phosphate kinase n=1 Tax=Neomoorella stamsii TaxID=1266720 RepID=A0A9X7P647_9FIRM|nr:MULTISPECIES: 1-phosphofructokinase [Moorella]PRR72594.1 Tagatose-6-phosphate kinase [Moorella stamsii]CEP67750.1 Tagatose/fructose phosphokinase [Moorella glycerini]
MPAPIITVTLNPALDKTVVVENFEPGKTNRARIVCYEPGGKGINVAKYLHELNYPVIATGFLAGHNGILIKEALQERGILADFIEVEGETRINLKVIDPVKNTETEINENGFIVRKEDLTALEQKLDALLSRCRLLVLSGSLPGGVPGDFYATLIRQGQKYGIAVILDAEGEALEYGLAARPLLVKPNKYEAETLLDEQISTPEDAVRAGIKIRQAGAAMVVISLGALGAVAVDGHQALWAQPPRLAVGSTVGAGDAMVAVLARAISEGTGLAEALPLAVAAGTRLAARRTGPQNSIGLETLARQVQIMPIKTRPASLAAPEMRVSG